MSKVIQSPVAYFAGNIVLPDFLNFNQIKTFWDAMEAGKALGKDAKMADYMHTVLPGIIACVKEWHLEKIDATPDADSFPFAPATVARPLYAWLVDAVHNFVKGESEIPNA